MRTRSSSSGTVEMKLDSPTKQDGKTSAGKRFAIKLPKFRRNCKSHNNVHDAVDRTGAGEPIKEVLTFAQNLERLHFCEAAQQLIDIEEHLLGQTTDRAELVQHEELGEDRKALFGRIRQTWRDSLIPDRINVEALKSAVAAICLDEKQDQRWEERSPTSLPAWRPGKWRQLHDDDLKSLVEERLDGGSTTQKQEENQSSIQKECLGMGKLVKEDLTWVVDVVKGCYPAEMDVCNFYARLYHQAIGSRLSKIAEFVLDDKDCACLLCWVNDCYPNIFKKQELKADINYESLGMVLPEELCKPLETQYLKSTKMEVKTHITQTLKEVKQKFNEGEEPENEDGYYFSPLAIDVVQFIEEGVRSAESILRDQPEARTIRCLLHDFLESFKSFHDEVLKGNKANSKTVTMANLVSVEQLRDYIVKKADYFPENIKEKSLSIVTAMKQSGNAYLLRAVHKKLKPQFQILGTNDWLNKELFEDLLDSIEESFQQLQGLNETCNKELMGQFHQDVMALYVERLLKGSLKLKNKTLQEKVADAVIYNEWRLRELFTKAGSKEDWLTDILVKIAEVLKLQDLPSLQIEIVSLGTAFPDLSRKHVSALLKLKTNITRAQRAQVKETLRDHTAENTVHSPRQFFAKVQYR